MEMFARRAGAAVLLASALWLLAAAAPRADDGVKAVGDFRGLPTYVSHDGVLNATLVAAPKAIVVGGVRLAASVFNGEYGGPVLEVKPGDKLNVRLVNHTSLPINIHFHGSYASPAGHGDNVHTEVDPGTSFDYHLTVPRDQPPGLYWYHTHIHGLAEAEVNAGLSGAMIVDGVQARIPETAAAKTRLLVLKTFDVARPNDPGVTELHGVVQSINGAAHTEIHAQAGATEFWRISNQSANDYYHLYIKGASFRIVSTDGAPTQRDIPANRLDIAPAGRAEVMVTLPAAGDYPLMSGSTLTGTRHNKKVARELAIVKVTGVAPAIPAARPLVGVRRGPAAPDLRQGPIALKRLIVFSEDADQNLYMINGRTFDHKRIDVRVPLGTVEEWTIRNDTDDMHVFHIHQLHFQVVSIDGEAQPFDNQLDTVRVPERGEVTILIPFTNPDMVGRFVFHCHVLKHEDHGMMANVEVYDPRVGPDVSDGSNLELRGRRPWWQAWFGRTPWIGGYICHTNGPVDAAPS